MATFLRSPVSPAPAHTFYDHEGPLKHHAANLSGATMLDMLSGPEGALAAAYTSKARFNRNSEPRQLSHASSTISQLRQTNHALIELLRELRSELASQREVMFEMQSRLSRLEHASDSGVDTNAVLKAVTVHSKPAKVESTEDATRENQSCLGTRPGHAHECDPLSNASEFLKSPTRFSSFNFNFDLLQTIPDSSHAAPEVDDVPSLTPASDREELSGAYTPGNRRIPSRTQISRSGPTNLYHDAVSDIKEHVVEFDKVKIPAPPILQTPPRSARSKLTLACSREDDITALPEMPPRPPPKDPVNPQRTSKGFKSLFMYKMLLKSNKSERSPAVQRRSGSSLRC